MGLRQNPLHLMLPWALNVNLRSDAAQCCAFDIREGMQDMLQYLNGNTQTLNAVSSEDDRYADWRRGKDL